jgi:hypothetical protein
VRIIITILLFLAFFPVWEIWSNSKYELECNPVLLKLSRDSLKAQIGIKEPFGRNGGPTLKYQIPFGLHHQPYCAMAQDWCYWVNGSGMLPWFSPNAQAHYNYAKKHGKKVPYKPAVNDFIVWRTINSSSGHIERVDSALKAGWVITVGFNTSNGKTGSQREGNGVFPRRRNIYHPIGRLVIKGLVGFRPVESNAEKQGCNLR